MKVLEEKITAIEKVHNEFLKIMQHEKCRTCSCLHTDMMASILNTIQEVGESKKDDDKLTAAERDFSQWIMDAGKIDLHQWLGCKPCLPVPAFNTYNETMDMLNSVEESVIEPANITTTTPQEFSSDVWPVQPGDYTVFNSKASVAVLFLGDSRIIDESFFHSTGNIAIIGNLTTENIGVEYVVKNLISNPFIRHLAIIGKEVSGHRPGDAIINLQKKGINTKQRIVDASGARPILRNTLTQEITQFRNQITIHDFQQCKDKNTLKNEIKLLNSLDSIPFDHGLHVRLVDPINAEPAKRLQLDREGYFIILIRKGNENPIYVEHYNNNGRLLHIIEGKDAPTICSTIINMELVSQLDHAAYLGRELAKAENSIYSNTEYIQDQAQGNLSAKEKKATKLPESIIPMQLHKPFNT